MHAFHRTPRGARARLATRHSPHSTLSLRSHYRGPPLILVRGSINLTLLEGETRRTDGAQAWGMGATS